MQSIFNNYLTKHHFSTFNLKAILFDMDGVLYDSMRWHAKAWKQTMDEFNIPSTAEEFYSYEGMVGRDTIKYLIRREWMRNATEEETDNIYKRKTELFSTYNDNSLIPYAYQFVHKVYNNKLGCVIVTGSGQPSLIDKLDRNFDGIFTREKMVNAFDVKFGKPNPEPYIIGLEKAGNLKPNEAIVIENAPRGIEASVAAGIFTIAINTGPLPKKVLSDAGANIVLPSMKSLFDNWDMLLNEINYL